MATELFSEIKRQAALLSADEKKLLASLLNEQAEAELSSSKEEQNSTTSDISSQQKREQHLAWLKTHREEYSGQYVALDGDRLVGHGLTMREAIEQAKKNGIEKPFVTYILSIEIIADGGL